MKLVLSQIEKHIDTNRFRQTRNTIHRGLKISIFLIFFSQLSKEIKKKIMIKVYH